MFIFKFKPQSEATSSETSMTNSNIMKQQHQQQHQLQQQAINNYWISNYQLSESEFDTTRLSCYLNALNLSRRNRSRNRTTGQQQNLVNNNNISNNNISNNKHIKSHHHIRSKSVDAPLNRLRMSLVHKPVVGSLITTLTSGAGAKIISSNNNNNSGNPNCSVLVTRSESLNSEGSSLGESGAGEFGSSAIHNPGKSALKKGSPNNQSDQHHQLSHQGKKNVTFSAYAMIQVMDG